MQYHSILQVCIVADRHELKGTFKFHPIPLNTGVVEEPGITLYAKSSNVGYDDCCQLIVIEGFSELSLLYI